MKIDIGGRQVEVDDSFNSLTPDRQQATVDEIQRSFQMEAEAKAKIAEETAKKTAPVGTFDVMNSQSGFRQNVFDPAMAAASGVAATAAEHPWLAAGAAAMLPNSVLEKIPGLNKIAAAKNVVGNLSSAAQAYAANAQANQAMAETAAAREARIAQRPGMGVVPKTAPTMAPTAPVAPSMTPSYAPAGAPTMAPGAMPTAPVAPAMGAMPPPLPATPPPLPATAAPAQTVQQMAMDKLKMLGGLSQKVAPMLQGASRAIAPLAVAKELFYTSPEERAILQAAEDKKRAQGWKPLSERF